MAQSCEQCPHLRAQIAELKRIVAAQQRQIEFLQARLGELLGGVKATVTFIEQETDQPSMPRRQMIGAVHARLTYCIDLAEGRTRP